MLRQTIKGGVVHGSRSRDCVCIVKRRPDNTHRAPSAAAISVNHARNAAQEKWLLFTADCRRKTRLRAKVALNRLELSVLQAEILHVAKRLAVHGVAKVFHKSIVRAGAHPFNLESLDETNLRVPALGFESAFVDVVISGSARKGEVVGEECIEGGIVFVHPRRVPFAHDVFGRGIVVFRCAGANGPGKAGGGKQGAGTGSEQISAGYDGSCHSSSPYPLRVACRAQSYKLVGMYTVDATTVTCGCPQREEN